MHGRLRYIAFLTDEPAGLANFYGRHLGLETLARSNHGDVSLTDGYFNLTFLKARDDLDEPDTRRGLHHVGLEVDDIDAVTTAYLDRNPRGMVVPEPGGPHFGECRIFDPESHAVSLSRTGFGVDGETRRRPCLAHVALNALDPTAVLNFYIDLFGVRELGTSHERRQQGRKNRFAGDGFTNLAIHPYYNPTLEGHEARFGINHIGFIVADMEAKLDSFAREVPVARRPDSRPYAEYRLRDPEANGFDLSQIKGWEVDIGRWEGGQ